MLRRLINRLSLTPTEQKVILFLAGTLIVGAGIRYYRESSAPQMQFDYRSIDSSFSAFKARVTADTVHSITAHPEDPVDINAATQAELVLIPGIGTTLAERILRYRVTKGGFSSIDELQKVKGISKKKLEKLKPFIAVH